MVAAIGLATAPACVGWSGAGPAVQDEVAELHPADAGTYRMTGTERDSRTGRTRPVSETYTVQPYFTRGGDEHQVTDLTDSDGSVRTWETRFASTGAFRLRESTADSSALWVPPLRSVALPLRVGRTWTADSTATVPDLAGVRRVTRVAARSEVVGTGSVVVGGRRVFTFVIGATVTTTVIDTIRASREETRTVSRTSGRTWFAPAHMLVVRSSATTTVRGGPDGAGGRYSLVRRMQLERL